LFDERFINTLSLNWFLYVNENVYCRLLVFVEKSFRNNF
jgi:hypothetical protein